MLARPFRALGLALTRLVHPCRRAAATPSVVRAEADPVMFRHFL